VSPTHALVHATLAKVIHGSEFAVMKIVRIDAIVAKSAQPVEFQRSLVDVPESIHNMWLLGWRARFCSTCRISTIAYLMHLGQCANMWRARFRSTWEHCSGYTFRPTTWHLRIFYVDLCECRLCPF